MLTGRFLLLCTILWFPLAHASTPWVRSQDDSAWGWEEVWEEVTSLFSPPPLQVYQADKDSLDPVIPSFHSPELPTNIYDPPTRISFPLDPSSNTSTELHDDMKEIKSTPTIHPDIHPFLDYLEDGAQTEELIFQNTTYIFVPSFRYRFYEFHVPEVAELKQNESLVVVIQSTRFCGEYSIYGLNSGLPSYFKRQEWLLSGTGGVSWALEFTSHSKEVFYMSVEGTRKSVWNQYEFTRAPDNAYLSLTIWMIREAPIAYPILSLKNGVSDYSQALQERPIYYVYESTDESNQELTFTISALVGSSYLYMSSTNPYPGPEDNEYHFIVQAGTTSPYVAGQIPFLESRRYYFAIRCMNLQSTQILMVHEGDADVELASAVTYGVIRDREGTNGPYYKLYMPSTASYRWLRVTVECFHGGSLFIKNGQRPTRLDFDWVWHCPTDVEYDSYYTYWYISASDVNFNQGYFYFWYSYTSLLRAPTHDQIRVNLDYWAPHLV